MIARRAVLIVLLLLAAIRLARPAPTQVPIEITFCYTSDPAMDINVELCHEFEALHPEIHVNHLVLPAEVDIMHDRFVTSMAAGQCDMDCFALDVIWVAEFANAGWLHPLDEYITRDKFDSFVPSVMPSLHWKGRLYAMPWSCSVGTFFYRKDLLARAGLRPPQTWDELISTSERLKVDFPADMDEPFVCQAARYEGLTCDFMEYLWGNDADVFDAEGRTVINQPRAVESLTFFRDLITRYKIVPPAVTAYMEQDGYLIFTQGRAPFLRSWPYVMRAENEDGCAVRGQIGLTRVPGHHGPGHGCIGTWNMGVSALSPHPREAFLLLDFLTERRAQKRYAITSGLNPSRADVYTDPEVVAKLPYLPQFLDVIKTARALPTSPLYPKISSILQIEAHRALSGELTPREALDEAAWKLDMLRERYRGVPLQ